MRDKNLTPNMVIQTYYKKTHPVPGTTIGIHLFGGLAKPPISYSAATFSNSFING